MSLKDQPSAMPTRKVTAGTVAGVLTAALVAGLREWNPDLVAVAGPLIEQLVPVAVAFVAAYFTRERAA